MKRLGFTIIEIIITITIMGLLLTLVAVSVSSSQANARDSERKGDVEAIALNFEAFYNNRTSGTENGFILNGGSYPGTAYLDPEMLSAIIPDIDPQSIHAPDIDLEAPMSLVAATTKQTSIEHIEPRPSKDNDVYVYQPFKKNNDLCVTPTINDECRKFYIYYYQETTDTVERVTSKNQ